MKKLTMAVTALALLSAAGIATAYPFDGAFAVGNWTIVTAGDGSVDTSGAPSSVQLFGSNNGVGGDTTFTIAAPSAGIVTFDWVYHSDDSDGPSFDPFGFLINGNFNPVSDGSGGSDQSGSASFNVNAGDIFGFDQNSADGGFGGANTIVSNFSFTETVAAVPEPASLTLLGLGVLGMAGYGWRRRAQKPAV